MLQELEEEEGSALVRFSNALQWMLHAHVEDCAFVCRPWSSFNDAALHDRWAAQNRLLWRDKTCPAQVALHELESIKMTVTYKFAWHFLMGS